MTVRDAGADAAAEPWDPPEPTGGGAWHRGNFAIVPCAENRRGKPACAVREPHAVRRHDILEGTVATDELSIDVAHRVDGPFVGETGRRDDGLPYNV